MRKNAFSLALLFLSIVAAGQAVAAPNCPSTNQGKLPGESGFSTTTASGLAYANYYLTAGQVGGTASLIGIGTGATGGWTSGGQPGFTGNNATIYTNFLVPPNAPHGTYADVEVRIISQLGAVACSSVFRVYVN